MKTKSPLLIAIGALALFVSLAFPSSTALADCGDPDEPYVYYEYGGPTGIRVKMYVGYPTGANIYFTTNGSNPTHDGSGNPGANTSIYIGSINVPYGQCIYIRAMTWKPGSSPCWNDTAIVYFEVCNPVQ